MTGSASDVLGLNRLSLFGDASDLLCFVQLSKTLDHWKGEIIACIGKDNPR